MTTAPAPPADGSPPPQEQMSGGAFLRLIGVGAAIGIPAALLAAVFLALVHESQQWLWHDLPDALNTSKPGWYLVIGLPAVGACVVYAARRLLPGDGGHQPLKGISGGPTLFAWGPGVVLAAIGTLTFGAVLGPEAPLIAIGSVIGMGAASVVKLGEKEHAVLANAGSFAAISALFGGPLVGGVLMLEGGVGMGAAILPVLIPGFVASALGYVIFLGLGSWGGLNEQAISVPGLPVYNHEHVLDLITAVAIGVIAALLITLVRRGATRVQDDGGPRFGMFKLLVIGGLLTGVVAEVADLLGANSQDVLFSGQSSIPALVSQSSTKIVVILLVAKAIGYAICLGCGFRGGPVFPAIFIGVAIAMLAVVWLNVPPTFAVAAGSAAGMAAMTRLLLSSMLFATLLVGHAGVDAAPAIVLAASASWLTMQAIDKRAAVRSAAAGQALGA
jgi:H+/Cl- antiporter ClcA